MKKLYYFAAIAAFASVLFMSCEDPNNSGTKTDPSTTDEGVIINGVKWATRNIAAPGHFADTPESAGMFYQWNRKIGWSSTNPMTNSNGGTTWDSTIPDGTEWETGNDPSPAGWRIPTLSQIENLGNTANVSYEWTTQNGVYGRLYTDLKNKNTLFLPASGYRDRSDGALNSIGVGGNYWSSTYNDIANTAYFVNFGSGRIIQNRSHNPKAYGYSVRCVAE
ncbi:MAG: hypothetical protein LBN95_07815 [Prevotellaceae bacterium]|nr:hypothetical protein [Prevotellaceae bacterium]